MKAFEIFKTVLICLGLGLMVGAGAAVAARIVGVEPMPPGVLGAVIGAMAAALAVQRRRRA
jgi:hypothetical protein